MKNLKYKIKNSNLVELIIHNIKLCLLGTNGNYLKFIIFFGLSISTALFESLPILIVIPFIGILTNSEKAFDNKLVKILGNLLDIDDTEKRTSQYGKILRKFEGQKLELSCTSKPNLSGESMALKFLNSDSSIVNCFQIHFIINVIYLYLLSLIIRILRIVSPALSVFRVQNKDLLEG